MSKKPPAIDAMHPVDKILFPIMIELHGAFSQMQEKLADYIDYLKETEKIENELSIAQEILLSMTPHSFPPFPNLPQVDLYATFNSAREAGGDFYDSFRMDDDTFCFAVDDVMLKMLTG
jgi:phosphoserine phosphatase RsbU/P